MHVVYAKQPFPESWTSAIFLAGPTPRDKTTPSWRGEALLLLEELGYDGVVFVPETADGNWAPGPDAYVEQIEWERRGLDACDVAVFWVPREMPATPARVGGPISDEARTMLKARGFNVIEDPAIYEDSGDGDLGPAWEPKTLADPDETTFYVPKVWSAGMPALTTNVEFGLYAASGKIVFGAPPEASSVRYLQSTLLRETGDGTRHRTLRSTLEAAVARVGAGALRTGGEKEVPLHIWKTPAFQAWLASQKAAGNRLDGARLLWHFRIPKVNFIFSWVLHVRVWIAAEERHKENEYVFARSDISTVCLYSWPSNLPDGLTDITDVEVVLIREFRSPGRTDDGFVHELAGGSSFKPGQDPLRVASEEVHEETGLIIPASRFREVRSRQLAATLSAHHAHLFAAELTQQEMAQARLLAESQETHGVVEDTERTYVEVTTLREMLAGGLVDWSMIGMVAQAVLGSE